MTTQHTPGPWQVVATTDRALEVRDADDGPVCQLWKVGNKDRHSMDARLIAAAPELLDMLEKLVRNCDGESLGTVKAPDWTLVCQASALIAKAKGK